MSLQLLIFPAVYNLTLQHNIFLFSTKSIWIREWKGSNFVPGRQSHTSVHTGDIIKKAGINRSTFYRHYVDKYAILDRIQESAIPMGESMIAPFIDGEHNPFDILFNSDYLTSVVPEHFKKILLILLKVKTESFDMEKVVKEGYMRGFPIAEGDPMGTLKSELYADICYRLLIYSLMTNKKEDFNAYNPGYGNQNRVRCF